MMFQSYFSFVFHPYSGALVCSTCCYGMQHRHILRDEFELIALDLISDCWLMVQRTSLRRAPNIHFQLNIFVVRRDENCCHYLVMTTADIDLLSTPFQFWVRIFIPHLPLVPRWGNWRWWETSLSILCLLLIWFTEHTLLPFRHTQTRQNLSFSLCVAI